jgi:hypothetical protein
MRRLKILSFSVPASCLARVSAAASSRKFPRWCCHLPRDSEQSIQCGFGRVMIRASIKRSAYPSWVTCPPNLCSRSVSDWTETLSSSVASQTGTRVGNRAPTACSGFSLNCAKCSRTRLRNNGGIPTGTRLNDDLPFVACPAGAELIMLEAQRNETRPRLADCDPDWQFCRHHRNSESQAVTLVTTQKSPSEINL